jgi:hypothetical protein
VEFVEWTTCENFYKKSLEKSNQTNDPAKPACRETIETRTPDFKSRQTVESLRGNSFFLLTSIVYSPVFSR